MSSITENITKAEKIQFGSLHDKLDNLKKSISSKIIGQRQLIENLLVCLLADGHILIEGMPGLAKTSAAKAVAEGIEADFHRVQFTPDLLPSDLIGTEIYVHEAGKFSFREGPIFNNIVLADEINRAPAKVQSALLEAMGERQVTVGHKTYKLPELYMVIATQNPVEQEGTYNLPEAQLDRFLMHCRIEYPSAEEELQIIDLDEKRQAITKVKEAISTSQESILTARRECSKIFISDKLKEYVVALITATRTPSNYDASLANWIMYGASPRASLALIRASKALAWLTGSEFVTPDHIQRLCPFILSHRIILSFEAEAKNIQRHEIVQRLLEVVAVP